jgi:hypothetical protein
MQLLKTREAFLQKRVFLTIFYDDTYNIELYEINDGYKESSEG